MVTASQHRNSCQRHEKRESTKHGFSLSRASVDPPPSGPFTSTNQISGVARRQKSGRPPAECSVRLCVFLLVGQGFSDTLAAVTGKTPDSRKMTPYEPYVDRKSTRLNSSHRCISYAVFCLKKK